VLAFPKMHWEPVGRDTTRAQYHSPFDDRLHLDRKLWTGNGFWDSYRGVWPLLGILFPRLTGEMLDGWVNSYRDGGWTVRWSKPGYWESMIGTHTDIIFADADAPIEWRAARTASLLSFFAERLKVLLREQGARHDLVDAVLALGDQDDLLMIVRRVEALGRFLETEDGKNLLTGYRRAANMLRDEEKKSGTTFDGVPDLLQEPSEIALSLAINAAIPAVEQAAKTTDFEKAMAALAKLRLPVDAFFDKVLVNDPDPELRANRLKLLNRIREATRAVADFDKIAG